MSSVIEHTGFVVGARNIIEQLKLQHMLELQYGVSFCLSKRSPKAAMILLKIGKHWKIIVALDLIILPLVKLFTWLIIVKLTKRNRVIPLVVPKLHPEKASK